MTDGQQKTLYSERYEHDACGIGAIVSIDGTASYSIVNDALSIVEKLEHRAGKDAAGNILVIHCSSGNNNVVITTNSGFGFAARPRCY